MQQLQPCSSAQQAAAIIRYILLLEKRGRKKEDGGAGDRRGPKHDWVNFIVQHRGLLVILLFVFF